MVSKYNCAPPQHAITGNAATERIQRIGVFNDFFNIGDNFVRLKGLYVLKMLYPHAKIIYFTTYWVEEAFSQGVPYIDEIIRTDRLGFTRENGAPNASLEPYKLDILLLAGAYKYPNGVKFALTSCARVIAPFCALTFFTRGIETSLYRKSHPHREVYRTLCLVRKINKPHYDKNIHLIDTSQAEIVRQTRHKERIDKLLKDFRADSYRHIIALNAFGNTPFRFVPDDYALLAKRLSHAFPQILFIMINYEKSGYVYENFTQTNLKVFVNDSDLLNLCEFISRLSLLISTDTGVVHIADNAKIPIFEPIKRNLVTQWGGGSMGNECRYFVLPDKQKIFQKQYDKLKNAFFSAVQSYITQNFA